MDRLTPLELKKQNLAKREEQLAQSREYHDELRRLVQSNGYRYLKKVVMALVIKPLECGPDAEQRKWDTYNTVRWGFERQFALIESIAGNPTELPKGIIND